MKSKLKALTAMAMCIFATTSVAGTGVEKSPLDAAQAKLSVSFKNLQFTAFKPSPIEGLYQIETGGQIIYFHPGKELLLFGEIYSKEGKNLTAMEIGKGIENSTNALPINKALVIGPEDAEKTIIEFTDPNCAYCKSFDRYVTDSVTAERVKRVVFFDTRTKASKQKAVHILCSQNPKQAMERIYKGIEPRQYSTCDEGIRTEQEHANASRVAGINGTPSFIIEGRLIVGFRPSIKKYIEQ